MSDMQQMRGTIHGMERDKDGNLWAVVSHAASQEFIDRLRPNLPPGTQIVRARNLDETESVLPYSGPPRNRHERRAAARRNR